MSAAILSWVPALHELTMYIFSYPATTSAHLDDRTIPDHGVKLSIYVLVESIAAERASYIHRSGAG